MSLTVGIFARRNVDNETKKEYIEEYFRTEDEWDTDREVADMHGVTRRWVNDIRTDGGYDRGVQSGSSSTLNTEEEKRVAIWEYVHEYPDESNRAVGRELGVSDTTVVTKYRMRWVPILQVVAISAATKNAVLRYGNMYRNNHTRFRK